MISYQVKHHGLHSCAWQIGIWNNRKHFPFSSKLKCEPVRVPICKPLIFSVDKTVIPLPGKLCFFLLTKIIGLSVDTGRITFLFLSGFLHLTGRGLQACQCITRRHMHSVGHTGLSPSGPPSEDTHVYSRVILFSLLSASQDLTCAGRTLSAMNCTLGPFS